MGGRTIVITGASDGIGAAAASRLQSRGENVVVVGRSEDKTRAVAERLGADQFTADYSDLSQVRMLAQRLLDRYPRIDVLANNAGGMTVKPEVTVDGYEKTFQVNYLAPFLLTTALVDRLIESRATVLNTASASQKLLGKVTIDELENTTRYRPSKRYALSKLAVILFSVELHRRCHGAGLSVAAFHPGYVASNFGRASGSRLLVFMERTPTTRLVASPDDAAKQLVWLATTTPGVRWQSGCYYSRHRVAKAHRQAYDPVLAGELWDRSAARTSLTNGTAGPRPGGDGGRS
jgi:NAD(P)-dependent dehydrogenase (short-subunit alcohol dehydrogenase family)